MDTFRFNKDEVVQEIREEGYNHHFFFANFNDIGTTEKSIKDADEVWVWGDCQDNAYYKLAKKLGADIWQMKL